MYFVELEPGRGKCAAMHERSPSEFVELSLAIDSVRPKLSRFCCSTPSSSLATACLIPAGPAWSSSCTRTLHSSVWSVSEIVDRSHCVSVLATMPVKLHFKKQDTCLKIDQTSNLCWKHLIDIETLSMRNIAQNS